MMARHDGSWFMGSVAQQGARRATARRHRGCAAVGGGETARRFAALLLDGFQQLAAARGCSRRCGSLARQLVARALWLVARPRAARSAVGWTSMPMIREGLLALHMSTRPAYTRGALKTRAAQREAQARMPAARPTAQSRGPWPSVQTGIMMQVGKAHRESVLQSLSTDISPLGWVR